MSTLEFRLLNEFQRDLPLCPAPYAAMGRKLGLDEATVIDTLARLAHAGKVSRVGAVFRPHTVSASTLAAMRVPQQRVEDVARIVSACPGVSHNYARIHRWNLWFVAAAADESQLAQLLDDLEARCGCPMLRLPLVESYHIDLGFDLSGGAARKNPALCGARSPSRPSLSAQQSALAAGLATGLAFVPFPFAELAVRVGTTEAAIIRGTGEWLQTGVISRLGVIVRHHELGYTSNAMVAFDIPDELATQTGRHIAAQSGVTLCARRTRSRPDWPYNVYCMIHGRSDESVIARIELLREQCSLDEWPFAVLFSTRRFKQQAAIISSEVAHG
jgi:DNA-binding Lrp family transcriptional regulator